MSFAAARVELRTPGWPSRTEKRLSALVLAAALVAGVGLRVLWPNRAPPAFWVDEALFGYDAYSLLATGRDHHGNFLPIAVQGFNTYNMPIFPYSLVPLVGAFGLKPAVVRLGVAIWGSLDLVAMTILAGLMMGLPGAAVAALLGALSPSHLPWSRFAVETITAPATVDLAMVCFFFWVARRRDGWLLLSGLFFGLSLYSYSITWPFAPLMIALLAILYRRELRQAAGKSAGALGIVLLSAVPLAVLLVGHSETQALSGELSVFNRSDSLSAGLRVLFTNWVTYFTPSYLFLVGDFGEESMWRPPGFGSLLPEQAPLIALAVIAALRGRHRGLVTLLLGWLVLATLPGALTMLPPHAARRAVLAIAPWTLLSALGFVAVLDLTSRTVVLRATAACLILGGTIFHGARFVRAYFRDFPILAAANFKYGVAEVVQAIGRFNDGREPVIITPDIPEAYMYVLFFERYPPALFQRGSVLQVIGGRPRWSSGSSMAKVPPHQPVLAFDRYRFVDPRWAYPRLEHGTFVFPGDAKLPAGPKLSIRYPDGRIAYNVVVK